MVGVKPGMVMTCCTDGSRPFSTSSSALRRATSRGCGGSGRESHLDIQQALRSVMVYLWVYLSVPSSACGATVATAGGFACGQSTGVARERIGGAPPTLTLRDVRGRTGLRGCLQSLALVLNLMNEPQIVPQRPDGRTVGDPRAPTPTSQTRRPAPYSGPAGGSERHPVFASERMPLADGSARSASLADPVQVLPQLDHGWNVGTSQ